MKHTELCTEATKVVSEVGAYLREHWGNVGHSDISVKVHPTGDHDMVTTYDLGAESMLQIGLARIDPSLGFTGEEGGCHKEGDNYWLVDPIDGTNAFIRGLPFSTVQIALIEDDQPVIGIIYDFIREEMVYAVKGMGAMCNNRPTWVSKRDLKTGQMIMEIDIRDNPKHQQIMLGMCERTTLSSYCASGWEFIQIACGRIEGKVTYIPWAAPHDLAPGHLIVAEAGGTVTNIGQPGYDFSNTDAIAGNPVIHRELTMGPNALFPLS